MSFAKLSLMLLLLHFPELVLLNLLCQCSHVGHVILLTKQMVVRGNDVLFLLLPPKLLPLEFFRVFYFFTFFLEPFIGLAVDFLKIRYVLLAFCFSMVVNFERALGSQEIWVCVIMVVS